MTRITSSVLTFTLLCKLHEEILKSTLSCNGTIQPCFSDLIFHLNFKTVTSGVISFIDLICVKLVMASAKLVRQFTTVDWLFDQKFWKF